MEFKTADELATAARERGTVITTDKKRRCVKCGCIHYYTRAGRKVSSCIWCAYMSKRLPKQITEAVYKAADGTAIYEGKACRNCGSREHLAEKAHGAKEGACYQCAVAKASSKGATRQVNRLRQQIKHQTFNFVVNSITRSDSVDVAPRNWSEHWLVMALHEDCKRLNRLEEIKQTGVTWQVGHHYPASGGGTEYRGKATIENLYLVRTEQNRSDKDGLPEQWNSKQVVWIGDLYDTITSREAAAAYRQRLGLDTLTKQQIQQQKQRENEQNAKHYAELKRLSADVVDSINLALSSEADYQALRDEVALKVEKIDRQAAQRIKTARNKGESIFHTEGGIIEEGLHGAKARCRIILNTIDQFEDIEQERRHRLKSPADIGTLNTQASLIKRALLYWARDVLSNPKRDVEGFTHPLLEHMANPQTWGIQATEDGRLWLCGWMLNAGGEPVTLDVKKGRNAEYITMTARRFMEAESQRKAAVTERLKAQVENARHFVRACRAFSHNAVIPVPDNLYDTEEIEQRKLIGRKLMDEKLYQQENRLDEIREAMNRWHKATSKGGISAHEVEKQSQQWIDELSRYQNEPTAPPVYNVEIEHELRRQIKQEISQQETPY
ncbi:hypothetical protein B5631_004558 [Salmonella enterica subsp. enterica serovar Woodinville]|nr:hypothetical protein [Salmonella enterica]EDS4810742.1 hypothetical protein [Salmonella enterica subsp. enterica serovar Woodinville]EBL6520642.1 hypothetical protein [Salmonella enterica]ECL7668252.1 hypothetical protein [Salmonella enterica]EEH6630286.1 hypothetical protein [Salmonella enterica]